MFTVINAHTLGVGPLMSSKVCPVSDDAECGVCLPSRPIRDRSTIYVKYTDEFVDVPLQLHGGEVTELTIGNEYCLPVVDQLCEQLTPADLLYRPYINEQDIAMIRIYPGRRGQTGQVSVYVNGDLYQREVKVI